jgi:signal peptidase I
MNKAFGAYGFMLLGSDSWRAEEAAIKIPARRLHLTASRLLPISSIKSTMKNWIKDDRGLIAFLFCFGFFRIAIADWNTIPSGSMRPNLLEGDVVLVNRLAYDFKIPLTNIVAWHIAEPKRGDIVTFSSPKDGVRLIKRIIALPGDRVEMRRETLFINGKAAEYSEPKILFELREDGSNVRVLRLIEAFGQDRRRIQLLTGVSAKNTFGPMKVPDDNFLMLGDNRDNSADSRFFGFVPRHLLIGRAQRVLISADIKRNWVPRLERFWQRLQ